MEVILEFLPKQLKENVNAAEMGFLRKIEGNSKMYKIKMRHIKAT